MKDKVTAFLTLGCIFSLFFYYKVYSTNSNETITNINQKDAIDLESTQAVNDLDDSIYNVDISDSAEEVENINNSECSLNVNQTDEMSFSDSFKYYRECNGSNSLFIWNDKKYTTLLSSEIIVANGPCPISDTFKKTESPLQIGVFTDSVAVGEVFTVIVTVENSSKQLPAPNTVYV